MAGRFCTSFGINSLTNMIAGGYFDGMIAPGPTGIPSLNVGGGPFGGNSILFNGNGTVGYIFKNFNSNIGTVYFGQWMNFSSIGGNCVCVCFLDGSTPQVYLQISTGGQFSFYRGVPGSGTLLATNVAATVSLSRYVFVEVGIVFNGSTGSVEMKFNGTDVISLTGSLNTAPSGNNSFSVLQIGNIQTPSLFVTLTFNFADMYVCDSTGAHNNTFLGPGQSVVNPPTSNDTVQFTGTPNTGSNTYQNVNINPSLPTSYNYDSTATQQDTFHHAALPGSVSSIAFMQVTAFAALDAAGSRTAQVVFLSSGTQSLQPSTPVSVSPGYYNIVGIQEVDPHTSSPITPTAYNALTFGYYLAT